MCKPIPRGTDHLKFLSNPIILCLVMKFILTNDRNKLEIEVILPGLKLISA